MWLPIFLVGSFWFFALIGVAVIALIISVETESPFYAALTLIGFCLCLHLFGNFNAFGWAVDNPVNTAISVAAYFVLGALWSVGKWWFFVRDKRDTYNDHKRDFIADEKLQITVKDAIPTDKRKEFKQYMTRYGTGGVAMPEARKHKGRIMTWMAYWPWSMVWTLIDDPIKKMFRYIYNRLQRLYEKISESIWSGVDEDMRIPEPSPPTDALKKLLDDEPVRQAASGRYEDL